MGLLANGNIRTQHGNEYTREEWELKRQLEAEDAGVNEDLSRSAKAESIFRATLTEAGMESATVERLAAMGPVAILNRLESGTMKCSSPERQTLLEKAVNTWGKAIY